MRQKLSDFVGGYAKEKETKAAIKRVYENADYVIDTHTAVAASVYYNYKAASGDAIKTLIASTASPYKFTRSVMEALEVETESKSA